MTSFDTIPSLYIHIPYCGSKCSYCDFFSLPSAGVPDQYVDALVAQLRSFRDAGLLGRLETVYFGGGTPSLLSCAQLSRIMEEVCPHLEPDAEVTLEANPESLTKELLETAERWRVNRISMGIQSMEDRVLGCVGRRCTGVKARRALGLLAESGMAFCTDFIAGLPEQGDQEFLAGLSEVLTYKPCHVSLYSLTVEEGTRLHRQIESGQLAWFPEAADSQWIAGRDLLEAAGYLQYEVSNFAPAGRQESRHNCAYWRQQSYLGAGAGAAGTLYRWGASGELLGGLRYTNTTNIDEYVGFWSAAGGGQGVFSGSGTDSGGEAFSGHTLLEAMPAQREELDRDTLAFEHLMLALRMKEGVDCGEYRRRFGRELAAATGGQEADGRMAAAFKDFCRRGWMQERRQGGAVAGYTMTGEGLLFLNLILERLLEC